MGLDRTADRRRRLLARLPPLEEVLRGSVVERLLRCGKSGCGCASGPGHRAVYLSVTLRGGRTEQLSLPAALLPRVRRQVAAYAAWRKAVEELSALNRERLRAERLELQRATTKKKRRDAR